MRDEYFTFSEVCWMLGITPASVHKIAQSDKEFPMLMVGARRYVFPKSRFFAWYDKQEKNPKWRNNRVISERDEWMKGRKVV